MTGRLIASARGLFAESGSFRFLSLLTVACTILWMFAMLGSGGGGGGSSNGGGQSSAGGGGNPPAQTAPSGGTPQAGGTPPTGGTAPSYATQAAPAAAPAAPGAAAGAVTSTGQAYSFSAPTKVPPPQPVQIHAPVLIDPANPKPTPATAEPMLQGLSFNELK
jgi:hypothetical protein